MKLLIVDDEELTRTGVVSSIDWASLGISQVLEADDGLHGLETARRFKPEIILCDVRMPRMDGITMLEKLETILPDSVPIFMSGYSDKEYLKAAIKLKAVNYIEKPLNPQEIRDAILEAKELYLEKQRLHHGETLHSMETASRLALQLTVPFGANKEIIEHLCGELSLNWNAGTCFTTFIVQMDTASDSDEPLKREHLHKFQDFLAGLHMNCIYVEKRLRYLVYFVYGQNRPSSSVLERIGHFLGSQYEAAGKYFLAAGETAVGVHRACRSYASAVILLQSSFFFPCNFFLYGELLESLPNNPGVSLPSSLESDFREALTAKDRSSCSEILKLLEAYFYKNHSLLQNQAKDLYYKLLLSIESARKQLKIPGPSKEQENIVDVMVGCFSFLDLHQILKERTEDFFKSAEETRQEHPTIFLIKEYISQNYMHETLSVKDISSHVFLSASYVCTFFKNETGQTLNQYLTEYRMERAKQLLEDPRYKISDISSKVGYSDGNYFGKSFKKYSGLSPSEYREKMTQ